MTNTQGLVGYTATSDLKLWKTTDAGLTFAPIYDFASKVQGYISNTVVALIEVDPTNPSTIYVGIRGKEPPGGYWDPDKGALYKSTDGGVGFGNDLLPHQTDNGWKKCALYSLAIDPTNSNILYIGQNGYNNIAQQVMKSTDGAATWVSLSGTPPNTPWVNNGGPARVKLSPVNSSIVWALTGENQGHGMYYSANSGTTWLRKAQPLGGQWVYRTPNGGAWWNLAKVDNTLNPDARAILADPFNVSGAWESAGFEGLKRSADANLTWQPVFNRFFNALHATAPQVLYASGRFPVGAESIQWSIDGGSTWFNIGRPDMVGGGPLSVVVR